MNNQPQHEESKPAYYAIVPANVRYADIPNGAKLLYGEITALCNQKGYAWATNKYFADMYSVSARTIQRWVQALIDAQFIAVTLVNTQLRQITITQMSPMTKMSPPHDKNVTRLRETHDKNVTHNNTYINNTKNTVKKRENRRELDGSGYDRAKQIRDQLVNKIDL